MEMKIENKKTARESFAEIMNAVGGVLVATRDIPKERMKSSVFEDKLSELWYTPEINVSPHESIKGWVVVCHDEKINSSDARQISPKDAILFASAAFMGVEWRMSAFMDEFAVELGLEQPPKNGGITLDETDEFVNAVVGALFGE